MTTASFTGWHQLYLMQRSVTHLNYMPTVAQVLKDFLYQNLSLEDTLAYNEPLSKRASSGRSCSNPCCGVVPTLSSEVASLLTVTQHLCDHAVIQIYDF